MTLTSYAAGVDRKRQDESDRVEQLVTRAIRLSVDGSRSTASGATELARLAHHDRHALGEAWLHLVVPALRHPSRASIAAERMLAGALELEGDGERELTAMQAT